jgi:hypothetical protein
MHSLWTKKWPLKTSRAFHKIINVTKLDLGVSMNREDSFDTSIIKIGS